jgi:hypothetical protein
MHEQNVDIFLQFNFGNESEYPLITLTPASLGISPFLIQGGVGRVWFCLYPNAFQVRISYSAVQPVVQALGQASKEDLYDQRRNGPPHGCPATEPSIDGSLSNHRNHAPTHHQSIYIGGYYHRLQKEPSKSDVQRPTSPVHFPSPYFEREVIINFRDAGKTTTRHHSLKKKIKTPAKKAQMETMIH